MSNDDPFAEERWRAGLAAVIEEHELDQLSGVDAADLADFMADLAGMMVVLVKTRDRGMPDALGAVERAELAALRKTLKLMEVVMAKTEDALALRERDVVDLEILLKDARAQRDRALGV
jgi:DNA-binding LytR/AlgR family response regulator